MITKPPYKAALLRGLVDFAHPPTRPTWLDRILKAQDELEKVVGDLEERVIVVSPDVYAKLIEEQEYMKGADKQGRKAMLIRDMEVIPRAECPEEQAIIMGRVEYDFMCKVRAQP